MIERIGRRDGAGDRENRTGGDDTKEKKSFSRREFLIGVGTTLILAPFAAKLLGEFETLEEFLTGKMDGHDLDEVVIESKKMLHDKYGIELIMAIDPKSGEIVAKKVELEKYKVALRILLTELLKYPPEMIRKETEGKSPVIQIGEKLQSWSSSDQKYGPVAGVFFPPAKKRRLRIGLNTSEDPENFGKTIHHEFNHAFVDNRDVAQARKWKGFLTTKREEDPYPMYYSMASKGKPDSVPSFFLTEYAAKSVSEDQAVTAEYMMTPHLHLEFMQRITASKDPDVIRILSLKYNAIKNEYKEWSGGKIDQKFWDNMIKRGIEERDKRTSKTWKSLANEKR